MIDCFVIDPEPGELCVAGDGIVSECGELARFELGVGQYRLKLCREHRDAVVEALKRPESA